MNDGMTALMLASSQGHTWIAHVLVEDGADKDLAANDCMTALMLASDKRHAEIARLLVKASASKIEGGSMVLIIAPF